MKSLTLFLVAAIAICFSSCKKNNDEIKDIKTLFSNTIWTGEAEYTTRPVPEPFSVRFDAGGTFAWHELDGDFTGTYTVNNDSKTIVFIFSGGSKVTGTLINNNELINFQYGAAYPWAINTMELNNTVVPELSNTSWAGISDVPITLIFKAFSVDYVHPKLSKAFAGALYKVRHGCVRFAPNPDRMFFGVIKNGKIDGIEKNFISSLGDIYQKWYATKQ